MSMPNRRSDAERFWRLFLELSVMFDGPAGWQTATVMHNFTHALITDERCGGYEELLSRALSIGERNAKVGLQTVFAPCDTVWPAVLQS
jgi:hypothetical protein